MVVGRRARLRALEDGGGVSRLEYVRGSGTVGQLQSRGKFQAQPCAYRGKGRGRDKAGRQAGRARKGGRRVWLEAGQTRGAFKGAGRKVYNPREIRGRGKGVVRCRDGRGEKGITKGCRKAWSGAGRGKREGVIAKEREERAW